MTTTSPQATRIRWEAVDGTVVSWFGFVGTVEPPPFQILHPVSKEAGDGRFGEWALCVTFVGGEAVRYASTRDPEKAIAELKAAAERWLSGFVSSLGAVFPDRLREAVTAERDKRSKAALAVDPEWAAERHFGWADALDWVLALTGGTAPPSAGGGE